MVRSHAHVPQNMMKNTGEHIQNMRGHFEHVFLTSVLSVHKMKSFAFWYSFILVSVPVCSGVNITAFRDTWQHCLFACQKGCWQ
jgi:hypothetical protein